MQVLIYKTALILDRSPEWLVLGDPVELRILNEDSVSVYALKPTKWSFLFGKGRMIRIGTLGDQTAALLHPALQKNSKLRVRIVEIQMKRQFATEDARISVSVWGKISDLGSGFS